MNDQTINNDARVVDSSHKRLFDIKSRAIVVQLPDNMIAVHIPKDITDEEIDDLIRQIMPKVMKSEIGCVCGIYGYDFDERELYQIPEAITLAKRLVERGFISITHTSTLMDKEEKPHIAKLFGAFEIWGMATGRLAENGDLDVDEAGRNEFLAALDVDEAGRNEFLAALDRANKKAKNILFPTITDGQHRTRIS